MKELKALGSKVTVYSGLETFAKPDKVTKVTLTSDEVTAVCPVTSQPDWYIVEAIYMPEKSCIESKTWKLFLQSFRNEGLFCEALASRILTEIVEAVNPTLARVTVKQKPRGGVSIEAVADYPE